MSSLHAGDGVDRALEELLSDTSFDVTSTSIGAGAQQAQAVLNPPAVVPLEDEAPAAAVPFEVEAPAKTGPTRFRMGSEDPQDRTRGYSPYTRTSGPRRQSPARAMPSGFNPVRLPRQEAQPEQLREALRLRAMQSDGPPYAEARASAAAVAQATAVQGAAASSGIGSARILALLREQAVAQAQREEALQAHR